MIGFDTFGGPGVRWGLVCLRKFRYGFQTGRKRVRPISSESIIAFSIFDRFGAWLPAVQLHDCTGDSLALVPAPHHESCIAQAARRLSTAARPSRR